MTGGLPPIFRGSTPWLLAVLAVSIALLGLFAYQATSGWQEAASLLARRRAEGNAELLAQALLRDMQGAQSSILMSPQLNDFMIGTPEDVSGVVASAFARYPYPESFFGVRGGLSPDGLVFLNRTARPPAFVTSPVDTGFPVTIASDREIASLLTRRMAQDAADGHRFSAFEVGIGGVTYQVVARLLYRDQLRQAPTGALGFMVNVEWARDHYFPEVINQVASLQRLSDGPGLSVVDEAGRVVAGSAAADTPTNDGPSFELLFFDPELVMLDRPPDLPRREWRVVVDQQADPATREAISGARRTLVAAGVSALMLIAGLGMTIRAARVQTRLSELRSDFVSSVTHELKTPIATIRALGDTVASGRLSTPDAHREYAALVVQEAKRLGRLVDNLLAYSRITDVTEAYSFQPLSPEMLVDELLARFGSAIRQEGFRIHADVPASLPPVRADRTAMELLLDNLLDNAIRYSSTGRDIWITGELQPRSVVLRFRDSGNGIPADEIGAVTRKFYRGRRAVSGGSGLGLAIARRIVSDHRGTLAIESELGQGTTVSVTLPTADQTHA